MQVWARAYGLALRVWGLGFRVYGSVGVALGYMLRGPDRTYPVAAWIPQKHLVITPLLYLSPKVGTGFMVYTSYYNTHVYILEGHGT